MFFYLPLPLLLYALPTQIPLHIHVQKRQSGLASVYYPGDGHSGPWCADGAAFTPQRCHIAHRSWPLGHPVQVCTLHQKPPTCVYSFVGDRGPFGSCDTQGIDTKTHRCKGRWRIKRSGKDPGTWRGIADLSLCVAQRLGHQGLQPVTVTLLRVTYTDIYTYLDEIKDKNKTRVPADMYPLYVVHHPNPRRHR